MSITEKEIQKTVSNCIETCLNIHDNSVENGNYLYDTIQKRLFNPKLSNYYLKSFGIIPQKLPGFLAALFFKINHLKYKPILLPDFDIPSDIIDLGPALNTRGVQIKFYDFTNMRVLCVGINDEAALKGTKIEADIYSRYDKYSVPKLIERISPSIYVRELIEGKRVKKYNLHSFRSIIDELVEIYQSESIQQKKYNNYLAELKLKVKDDICAKSLKKLDAIVLKEDAEILLTRVHGDFAVKNIISCKHRLYLIDWERSSKKSMFYDIGNFIFKYSSTDMNIFQYMLWEDKTMNHFIQRIEMELNISICDKRLGLYALFLFERLAFEKELYINNIQRYKTFLKIWNKHIEKVL